MKLRLVSYNIHRAIGTDRRFRPERIKQILLSHQADVLLLQEVDFGVPRSRRMDMSARLAADLGYDYRAAGYNVRLREGMYGNATLSRLPIRDSRNINLTVGRRKRRGCQHTTVEVRGENGESRQVEIFNLHLGLSARERRQQLGLLVSAPEFASLSPSSACIIAGDFNDWRSKLHQPMINALGFRCATSKNGDSGVDTGLKTYPAFSPQGPLDRVYYRGDLELIRAYRCRHQTSKVASDHLPIIVDLDLSGARDGAGQELPRAARVTPA